jgi:TRAP-type C4-dicarboxylate transport system permease small subunit
MKRHLKLTKRFEQWETSIPVYLLVMMSFFVLLQVFSRYLFNFSFVWAEELVRYLMIWMVMIGASLVQSKNDHIRIDFFPLLAGPRGRRVMETFFRLCTLLFLVIILIKGIKIAYFNRLFESSGLRISMFWPTLAIPIGALLMGVYTTTALVRDTYRLFTWSAEKLREEDERLSMEKYQTEQTSEETSSSQGS